MPEDNEQRPTDNESSFSVPVRTAEPELVQPASVPQQPQPEPVAPTPVSPQPQTTPPPVSPPVEPPEKSPVVVPPSTQEPVLNHPGTLVLQWLTYAFWGWMVLALTWLVATSVGFYIDKSSSDDYGSMTIAYSLAAVIVLFIIAFVCDVLYARNEPLHKRGASMVIMIIHAVIFALCGIGALIAAVFAVVKIMIGDSSSYDGNEGAYTTLITGVIIAIVYAATLLRTLRPFKLKKVSLVFGLFMAVVAISATALGIAGPTLHAKATQQDRLIERGLSSVSMAVRNHTAKSDTLPTSLGDIKPALTGDAKLLVDKNLVEYIPGKKVNNPTTPYYPAQQKTTITTANPSYNYQLCVTYKSAKDSSYSDSGISRSGSITPDTYYHAAGRVCYDLVTSYSSSLDY